jgi:hypothetical protein
LLRLLQRSNDKVEKHCAKQKMQQQRKGKSGPDFAHARGPGNRGSACAIKLVCVHPYCRQMGRPFRRCCLRLREFTIAGRPKGRV